MKEIQVAALKIDFKIDDAGIVRIIDLGDGFTAGTFGFDEKYILASMLDSMHEATKAPIMPIFGELPYQAVCSNALNIPIVLRKPQPGECLLSGKDAENSTESFILQSELRYLQTITSFAWGKTNNKTHSIPFGLMAMEMHKALLYFLMQQEMKTNEQPKVIYWSNNTSPEGINLHTLDAKYGYFIKIVDRSTGCGSDVFYATEKKEVADILSRLRFHYLKSREPYKEHLYIIEPAYKTVKRKDSFDYNVTGRAFLTLIYHRSSQQLEVKIAAAKWIFPLKYLQNTQPTKDQVLTNAEHSSSFIDLTNEELDNLRLGILQSYAKVFKSSFTHEDLLHYCKSHPQMQRLISCFRLNAPYPAFLNLYNNLTEQNHDAQFGALVSYALSRYAINVKPLMDQLSSLEQNNITLFQPVLSLDQLLKKICFLSFLENFIKEIEKIGPDYNQVFNFIPNLIQRKGSITQMLDENIRMYLQKKSTKYDVKDFNRALRQAACVGDVQVMKIMIYSHRADPNASSSSNKNAYDYALQNQNKKTKEQCLKILAQIGMQPSETSEVALNK